MSQIPVVGEGFGETYRRPTPTTTTDAEETGREETYVETTVGGKRVTVIVRHDIVVEDPYLNLARAAAYVVATGSVFPAPRVPRSIKDHLIRTNITMR
jgi:hypothetical protein